MKAFDISLEDLPSGAKHLPRGGTVRLMELQEIGYTYIRP
jgi:intracellular sulfur oxidation DsrE/DsrF family protein